MRSRASMAQVPTALAEVTPVASFDLSSSTADGAGRRFTGRETATATTQGAARTSCRGFDGHKLNGAAAGDQGLCRCDPPVSQPEPQGHGLWPVAAGQDWCGYFTDERNLAE